MSALGGQSLFFSQEHWCCPDTLGVHVMHVLGVCNRTYVSIRGPKKVHNMDPNCGWAVPKRFLDTARHTLVRQMGSQGKKRSRQYFCTTCNKDPFGDFNIFPLGLRTLTGWCDLRQYHPVGLTYRHVPVSELVLRTLADWQYHNLV